MLDAKKRYVELKKKLTHYSKQYYIFDDPEVSDAEYDVLYKELLDLEKKYPELVSIDSPSHIVGAKISKNFDKVVHHEKMLSLENAFNEDDISAFFERLKKMIGLASVDVVLEPKLDGLSASLMYKNGNLYQASTRGDGSVGEDITKNILTLKNVPQKINSQDELEVRGEVVMLKSDFQQLNQERKLVGKKLFANPRNAASGSLRQLDANITKNRNLTFFAYSIISKNRNYDTQYNVLKELSKLGFSVAEQIKVCKNQEQALIFFKELEKQRADLEYDIDGVVYKVNDLELQKKLGHSTKYPRHSIAYKFPAERAQTTILDIVVQVGRTGNITPVAELLPVNVGGVIVSRATLHNKDEIQKRDIRVGDRVVIQRAGDVIPQVLYPILEMRSANSVPYEFPKTCPCCKNLLVSEKDEVAVKCINLNCEAQIIERLIHFVSKPAFNIEGLGERNIKFLFDIGVVKKPTDIFHLSERNINLKLEEYEGWGNLSVDNLFKSIEKSKKISLDKLIYSLGIPQVGKTVSKMIAEFFTSYDNMLEHIMYRNLNVLINIDGVGESIANDFKQFFLNENNMKTFVDLGRIVVIQNVEKHEQGKLFGKTVVFTGTLMRFSRDDIKKLAESYGAKVSSSVSAKTSFVVAGNNAGSKLQRAKLLGVPIIKEDDFLKELGEL